MRSVPDHPIAPPSGMVAVHRLVLYNKIGPGPHACHWCGCEVKWQPGEGVAGSALISDHLDWDHHNDAPENLVPSCNICNAHRTRQGDRRLIGSEEKWVFDGRHKERAVERECETCNSPFLARISQVNVGKGRFCSRSCARKQRRT